MTGDATTGAGAEPRIVALYRSTGHNFVGHHGMEPGVNPMELVPGLECVEGRGIRGDRFFDHRPDFKGQVTFFSLETHEAVCAAFGVKPEPSAYRRNVLVSGVELGAWIGVRFELQGVEFEGMEECRPCFWMDHAVVRGAEEFLRGRGGLRARIVRGGWLWCDPRGRR